MVISVAHGSSPSPWSVSLGGAAGRGQRIRCGATMRSRREARPGHWPKGRRSAPFSATAPDSRSAHPRIGYYCRPATLIPDSRRRRYASRVLWSRETAVMATPDDIAAAERCSPAYPPRFRDRLDGCDCGIERSPGEGQPGNARTAEDDDRRRDAGFVQHRFGLQQRELQPNRTQLIAPRGNQDTPPLERRDHPRETKPHSNVDRLRSIKRARAHRWQTHTWSDAPHMVHQAGTNAAVARRPSTCGRASPLLTDRAATTERATTRHSRGPARHLLGPHHASDVPGTYSDPCTSLDVTGRNDGRVIATARCRKGAAERFPACRPLDSLDQSLRVVKTRACCAKGGEPLRASLRATH
jgi:hypothetical protein